MVNQMDGHTITFRSLNHVDMMGIYNLFRTTLGRYKLFEEFEKKY